MRLFKRCENLQICILFPREPLIYDFCLIIVLEGKKTGYLPNHILVILVIIILLFQPFCL